MKTCTKCGEEKALEDFYRDRRCRDGRRPDCKGCRNLTNSKYYAQQDVRERQADYRRQYYDENRHNLLRKAREHHEKPEVKKRRAQYNSEYKTRPDVVQRRADRRRATMHKDWEYTHRRRCIKLGITAVIESFTCDDLVERWGDACVDCGGTWTDVEHVVPVAAGGPHSLENCRPACRPCNLRRWREYQRAAIAAYTQGGNK